MQITITARHFELTTSVKEYAEKEIRGLKKYFEQIMIADMILRVEKNRNVVELNIKVKKLNLISKASQKDMYTAIDNAVKKVEKQIKRYIGKLQRHHKKKNNRIKNIQNLNFETENDITKSEIIPDVLTMEQAIEKLKNNKENFLIFRNIKNEKLNLLKIAGNSFELSEIK